MISPGDLVADSRRTVVVGRRDVLNGNIDWYSGFIDGIFGRVYGITFTDKRLKLETGTHCSVEHTLLYAMPVEALQGKMDGNGVRRQLQSSPDHKGLYGSREKHIDGIVQSLGILTESYQAYP